ncbi:MAG: hypothetical protein ACREM6_16475, partial [Vulcanimicrobiaceae bacterium]
MERVLAHAAWYGDPESLELREALAQRLGMAADALVVGAGIDDLEGLLVRAYLAPRPWSRHSCVAASSCASPALRRSIAACASRWGTAPSARPSPRPCA